MPLGSETNDHEMVNGTCTLEPLAGASGFGAAGPSALAQSAAANRAINPIATRARVKCITDVDPIPDISCALHVNFT